ncbi:hypothetical protein MMC10_008499 [Thelotrema lepadinum]|nr:hypothetical protein [Thelotrema lepadinum]
MVHLQVLEALAETLLNRMKTHHSQRELLKIQIESGQVEILSNLERIEKLHQQLDAIVDGMAEEQATHHSLLAASKDEARTTAEREAAMDTLRSTILSPTDTASSTPTQATSTAETSAAESHYQDGMAKIEDLIEKVRKRQAYLIKIRGKKMEHEGEVLRLKVELDSTRQSISKLLGHCSPFQGNSKQPA